MTRYYGDYDYNTTNCFCDTPTSSESKKCIYCKNQQTCKMNPHKARRKKRKVKAQKNKKYVYYLVVANELFTLKQPPPKVALKADIPLYMTITDKKTQEEVFRLPGEVFYIGEL